MLIDIRLANVQAKYKREQLAKMYPKRRSRPQKSETVVQRGLRPALRARLPLLDR